MSLDSADFGYQRIRNTTDYDDHRHSHGVTFNSPPVPVTLGSDVTTVSHTNLAGMAAVPGKAARQKKARWAGYVAGGAVGADEGQ
jgi:hypothetical protein